MGGPEFGHIFDYGVVEREQSAIPELHDGDARQGFGYRGPVIDGLFINGAVMLGVRQPVEIFSNDLIVSDEEKAAADDALPPHLILIIFLKLLISARELASPVRGGLT